MLPPPRLLPVGYDYKAYQNGKFVSSEQVERWSGLTRRPVLGFVTQYLRRPNLDRNELLRRIEDAALDDELRESLRRESNIEDLVNFVAEHGALPGQ